MVAEAILLVLTCTMCKCVSTSSSEWAIRNRHTSHTGFSFWVSCGRYPERSYQVLRPAFRKFSTRTGYRKDELCTDGETTVALHQQHPTQPCSRSCQNLLPHLAFKASLLRPVDRRKPMDIDYCKQSIYRLCHARRHLQVLASAKIMVSKRLWLLFSSPLVHLRYYWNDHCN